MSKNCVLGSGGFIGGALAKRLGNVTTLPVWKENRTLYHFASHTHPKFELSPDFEMSSLFASFANLLPQCYEHGVHFVYPSSALVHEKDTQFSLFKKTLELMTRCYKTRSLGLRIFPVYGPGEQHTVISQWCRQMARGETPTVYGDGKQSRDFIYVDDVVDQILECVEDRKTGTVEIGTGVRTSFNEIIELINDDLGTSIKPRYVSRPPGYNDGVVCASPLPTRVSVQQGIRRILAGLKVSPLQEAGTRA